MPHDSSDDSVADPISEQARRDRALRARARRRLLKAGMILFNERCSTIPCTVRDLSETGARVNVSAGAMIPAEFVLVLELDGIEADCSVAWRRGEQVGLRFTAPPRDVAPKRIQVVRAPPPPEKPSLRRRSAV